MVGALAILLGIGMAVFSLAVLQRRGNGRRSRAVTRGLDQGPYASDNRHATDVRPPRWRDAIVEAARRPRELRLRELPWRARRECGWSIPEACIRSARPEKGRRRPLPRPVVLDYQERHQHDWHAELRPGGRKRQRIWSIVAFVRSCLLFPMRTKRWTASAEPKQ